MAGNVAPETEKPAPVTEPAFTVTATVPEDVKVTDFVTAVFSATLPNDRAVALTFSVGVAAFNCRANPLEAPPALAEIVADCAVVTDATVALNDALADAAGTVTEAGTVTALLLLERLTAIPPVGADPLNVTVHASVPAPVIDEVPQETVLTVGAVDAPVPLKTNCGRRVGRRVARNRQLARQRILLHLGQTEP